MNKYLYILVFLSATIMFSCKPHHLVNIKIPKAPDAKSIGLVVKLGTEKDTSRISASVKEALGDCDLKVMEGLFKNEIYASENFDLLYGADSSFIYTQPGLINLPQLLVVKVDYKVKNSEGKKTFGIEFFGKWISFNPIRVWREFYFAEIINGAAGTENDKKEIREYLAGQIHVKLCYEIHKYIGKFN